MTLWTVRTMGRNWCGAGGTEGHAGTSLGGDGGAQDGRATLCVEPHARGLGSASGNCAPVMGMRSNPRAEMLVRALLALAILAAPALALLYSVPAGLAVLAIGLFILASLLYGTRPVLEPRALRPIMALVWVNVLLGIACLAAAVWLIAPR